MIWRLNKGSDLFRWAVIALFAVPFARAEMTSTFDEDWLQSVVSIEIITSTTSLPVSVGTGFLIGTDKGHLLLVTAKHVITENAGNPEVNFVYRINNNEGNSSVIWDSAFQPYGGPWFLSKSADVACRFLGLLPTSKIRAIPLNLVLKQDQLSAGTPIVILGFPMGLRQEKFATPIVRQGMIARVDDDGIILDGFVFPGNSGGPIVYVPPLRVGGGLSTPFVQEQRLVGLVSQEISYVDTAVSLQTKRPRITFEENSGLTRVISVDDILDLINRPEVQKFEASLK